MDMHCNCENEKCIHTQNEEMCENVAHVDLQILYIGKVCNKCYDQYPAEYRNN